MNRPRVLTTAVVLSALALTAACGSSGGSADATTPADSADDSTGPGSASGSPEASGAAGSQETLEVTVGSLPIVPTAGLVYGVENGIFEEHGIELTVNTGVASEAMVASVLNGESDFVTLNSVAAMVALDQDIPIQVTSGFSHDLPEGTEGNGISAVMVFPESGIESPADLAGASIAVNTFNSGGTLTIPEVVREAGGEEPVEFVEIHFPDALPALERGDVDSIWVVEPFITFGLEAGAEVVSWNFAETVPGISTQVMIAPADQDPAFTERVTTAFTDVFERANADPEGRAAALASMLDMDPGLAAAITQEHYGTAIDAAALERYGELALQDGVISNPLDVTEWAGAE